MIVIAVMLVSCTPNKPEIDSNKLYEVILDDVNKGNYSGSILSFHGDLLCYYGIDYDDYTCWTYETIELNPLN